MPNYITKILSATDHLKAKTKYRYQSSLIIIVTLYIFIAIYFFDGAFPESPSQFLVSITMVISVVLLQFLTGYDALYSGDPKRNKYVKCFHKYLPSIFIANEFNLTEKSAKLFWYTEVFNKWRDDNHEMHYNYMTSLQRGFECRLAYLIIKFYQNVFIISLILNLIILSVMFFDIKFGVSFLDDYFPNNNYVAEMLFMLCCLFIFILTVHYNNPKNEECKGAFEKYNEINQMNIIWIKKNKGDLLNRVQHYDPKN